MQVLSFLLLIAMGIAVMILSLILDYLWARVLPVRFLYYILRFPGVVVHECSHILGCLLTGAEVQKVVLFSEGGGSVTYARPKIPLLGDVIISTAPVFCIPLVLAFCTWVFAQYLGCIFPVFPFPPDSTNMPGGAVTVIFRMFDANIVTRFDPWFILYLYLTLSLILSVAPSLQDLKNAAIGITLIVVAGILVYLSGIPAAISILDDLTYVIGTGFSLCLVPGMIALAVSLPAIIWYSCTHRHG
ncbi:M50 family metallopeptidase [Methanoregula sp.]|uniref:M50 family metallopeptidase n=1 Tax=Methanoregula sp. TaxID=2052170 RepID=UPI003C7570C1